MLRRRKVACVLVLLIASACSSRPRQFHPSLQAPPSDASTFEEDNKLCREQAYRETKAGKNGRLSSGVTGVAAGVGAGAVGAAATSGTYAGYGAAAAAGGVLVVTVPFVGFAAAWGIAKTKRLKKERIIKDATAVCLEARGYRVTGWEKEKKHRKRELAQAVVAN